MKDHTLEHRINNPRMEYYRHVYRDSKLWDGEESLEGKRIVVYCEQGYGDVIQMARYFKYLKPANVTLHCPFALCSLLEGAEGVDLVCPREFEDIPDHDLHVLSLSLPFFCPDPGNKAYLAAPEIDFAEFVGYVKIGIAWEGNPSHPRNKERCCPLKHFKKLQRPDTKFFMLQIDQALPELTEGCEDFEVLGLPMGDFRQTAMLLSAMDFVVSVDTSLLHLAGALGKRTYGLLDSDHDPRWTMRKWYDSVEMWRQPQAGDWDGLFEYLPNIIYHGSPYITA